MSVVSPLLGTGMDPCHAGWCCSVLVSRSEAGGSANEEVSLRLEPVFVLDRFLKSVFISTALPLCKKP